MGILMWIARSSSLGTNSIVFDVALPWACATGVESAGSNITTAQSADSGSCIEDQERAISLRCGRQEESFVVFENDASEIMACERCE